MIDMRCGDTFWRDAARGGVVIGAIVVAATYLKVWLAPVATVISLAELIAVFYCLYMFGRQRAATHDPAAGYSYGQNMGFVMALMVLSGFIHGIGYYFLVNFAVPEMAETMARASIDKAYEMYGDLAKGMEAMAGKMIANPFFWSFYGILAMTLYGGLVGLFVSAFVRRRPEPYTNNTQQDERQA